MLPQSGATHAEPETDTIVEYTVLSQEALEQPYRVILQNDDVTPMNIVVMVLMDFFELGMQAASAIMEEAHLTGHALVTVLPYQEAHDRIYRIHALVRSLGFPLTLFLEPDF